VSIKQRVRAAVTPDERIVKLRRRVRRLQQRVDLLEAEVAESRRLDERVAALTDIIQELLLPVAQRDQERLRALLAQHSDRF
jgi:hypothetical protein